MEHSQIPFEELAGRALADPAAWLAAVAALEFQLRLVRRRFGWLEDFAQVLDLALVVAFTARPVSPAEAAGVVVRELRRHRYRQLRDRRHMRLVDEFPMLPAGVSVADEAVTNTVVARIMERVDESTGRWCSAVLDGERGVHSGSQRALVRRLRRHRATAGVFGELVVAA